MFSTLLIANRGEIACRIVRTARRMGLATVAVYSDADAHALHVRAADRAVRLGPAPARQSYLAIERVIDAARRSGAEAIHPGYGFLSENADFAEACVAAGLVFIGPPAEAIRAMGSKAAAKARMEQAGVPLLPGYHGEQQDAAYLAKEAARIGFPVVIKAVAGGGGRGMRVVPLPGDFTEALAAARAEARSAFGGDRVLIERYLERPRHIEVQVFADTQGNVVHLFERDCSAQRRHQKVIEEAPAPGLVPTAREAMGQAAVAAARAVGYVGAGTVEFVSDGERFFFLEMNTRLQVEHPVTELVTGFDLVEWQLRIAAGEALPASGERIRLSGHAIEARLYAEDPAHGFAPAAGRLTTFRLTAEQVRIDSGVVEGDTVGVHYDPMLAKLIVRGETRHGAIRRMRQALASCEVAGVATNIDLLSAVVAHPVFIESGIDTGFIERHIADLLPPQRAVPPEVLAAASLAIVLQEQEEATSAAASSGDPWSPWHARDGWWLNADGERTLEFSDGEGAWPVRLHAVPSGWRLRIGDTEHEGAAFRRTDGGLEMVLDGVRQPVGVARQRERVQVRLQGATWHLHLFDPTRAEAEDETSAGQLTAPIPGQVTEVLAMLGRHVVRGATLVVLEAMKTIFRLPAPQDGVIAAIGCKPGDMVEEGTVLVTFAEVDAPAP